MGKELEKSFNTQNILNDKITAHQLKHLRVDPVIVD